MASTYMNRTLAANNEKKLTISVWIKLAKIQEQQLVSNVYSGSYWGALYFNSSGHLIFADYRTSYILKLQSTDKFKDMGAWMHIVANYDCSIGSPTAKLYVNGSEVTYSSQTIYSQNATTSWNTDYDHFIGRGDNLGGNQFDGQMSDLYFIQGYTYDASTFGETDTTTGEWKPITNPTINYGGTGGNSYHLKFENSGNMDLDSGSNNVTLSTTGNLTQTPDCPSHNFCTLNALHRSRMNSNNSGDYLINGANTFDTSSSNSMTAIVTGTIGVTSGKYYWESKIITNARMQVGITTEHIMTFPQAYYDETDYSAMTMNLNGTFTGRYTGSAADEFGSGTANTTNDILGFALDMDNKALYIHKNGTYLSNGSAVGVPTSGSSRTGSMIEGLAGSRDDYMPDGEFIFPVVMDVSTSGVAKLEFNFGNGYFGTTAISSEGSNASGIGKFEYDVPANYSGLSTKGLNE